MQVSPQAAATAEARRELLAAATEQGAAATQRSRVPTLHTMCCNLIGDSIINLDNALDILSFSRMHEVHVLQARAERFVRESWYGLRERHSADDMAQAIGREVYGALEREHADIDERMRRLCRTGTVLDEVVAPNPTHPIGLPSSYGLPSSSSAGTVLPPAAGPSLPEASKPRPPSKPSRFGGGGEQCSRCHKTVYPAERISTGKGVWHTACFRCTECNKKLAIHDFEVDAQLNLFCRVHFTQLRNAQGGAGVESLVSLLSDVGGKAVQANTSAANAVPVVQGVLLGERASSGVGMPSTVDGAHQACRPASASTPPPPQSSPQPSPRLARTAAFIAGGIKRDKCVRCEKTVYAAEKQVARASKHYSADQIYHKACFRCADCNTLLRPDNWELFGSPEELQGNEGAAAPILLCKTHYVARLNAGQACSVAASSF
jgi:hypothetical protein